MELHSSASCYTYSTKNQQSSVFVLLPPVMFLCFCFTRKFRSLSLFVWYLGPGIGYATKGDLQRARTRTGINVLGPASKSLEFVPSFSFGAECSPQFLDFRAKRIERFVRSRNCSAWVKDELERFVFLFAGSHTPWGFWFTILFISIVCSHALDHPLDSAQRGEHVPSCSGMALIGSRHAAQAIHTLSRQLESP